MVSKLATQPQDDRDTRAISIIRFMMELLVNSSGIDVFASLFCPNFGDIIVQNVYIKV
jgi:hypothetical protein